MIVVAMEFFIGLVANGALALLLPYYVADLFASMSVKGTRRRYLAVSVMATLIYPVFSLYVLNFLIDVVTENWIRVLIDIYICWYANRLWNRVKDEDNWWKGRGKKIGKTIKKAFTVSSPAAAGAGA